MKRGRFFSLVELLVVIAIISVLASLLLPALKRAKDMALASQCQGNQRQCGVAALGYAADFNDWALGNECSDAYVAFASLGTMMMGLGYAPHRGGFTGAPPAWGYAVMPFGAVFQCPSLPPPDSYNQLGGNYPQGKNNSNTSQSYGIRGFHSACYFPGEQIAADSSAPYRRLIKFPSLYQPSRFPYLVDSETHAKDTSLSAVVGMTQTNAWYMDVNTYSCGMQAGLHLRHGKRANVWFPDGHVGIWAAVDTAEFKCPGAGVLGSNPLGYAY